MIHFYMPLPRVSSPVTFTTVSNHQKHYYVFLYSECNTNYNTADVYFSGLQMPAMHPLVAGQCDSCKGKLVKRSDDTEEIIRERLLAYIYYCLLDR